jgi:hypothetical protein
MYAGSIGAYERLLKEDYTTISLHILGLLVDNYLISGRTNSTFFNHQSILYMFFRYASEFLG